MRFALIPSLGVALAAATPAVGCLPDPPAEEPPVQLPGQSNANFELKLKSYNDRMAELEAKKFAAQREGARIQEGQRWEESESVILAEVMKVGTMKLRDDSGHDIGVSPKVTLKPVKWYKGLEGNKARKGRAFHVQYLGSTSCGYYGGGDAVHGKVGDRFLVFVTKGAPTMQSITDSIGASRAQDPRSKAALGI